MNSAHDLPAFKLVLLGDHGVGKTSIVQRFEQDTFDSGIDPTIGASFLSKPFNTRHGPINLHIWDTAGQERYRSLVPTYARGACSALICFDMSAPHSFESVDYWLKKMEEIGCTGCIMYLIGNKIDLDPALSLDDARQWATSHKMKFFDVSAKTGHNIGTLFQTVADEISEKRPSAVPQYDHLLKSEGNVAEETKCC
jgi:small GTP-binding protein